MELDKKKYIAQNEYLQQQGLTEDQSAINVIFNNKITISFGTDGT
jgi:hypothetical protein